MNPAPAIAALFAGPNRKPAVILLLLPWLLTTFKYFGTVAFFLATWGQGMNPQAAATAAEFYHFGAALVLFGLIPVGVVKLVFREPLAAYGVRLGDVGFSLKALLVLVPILVLVTYPNARVPGFLAEYPFDKGAGRSVSAFGVHAVGYLLYYVGWEFLFRGVIQFGLRDRLGDWNAILVQTLASCLVHIGKPAGEIYGSIFAGLVWGWLVFRTGSLWAVLLMHWSLGVALDYFICFAGKAG